MSLPKCQEGIRRDIRPTFVRRSCDVGAVQVFVAVLINEPIDDGLLKEVLIDFHNGVFVCAHFRDLSGETKCAVGITSHCEFDPYRSI